MGRELNSVFGSLCSMLKVIWLLNQSCYQSIVDVVDLHDLLSFKNAGLSLAFEENLRTTKNNCFY